MAENQINTDKVWQTMGGCNSRTGCMRIQKSGPLTHRQTLPAQGGVFSSPVFSREGDVFIADMAGGVQAFSSDGSILWKKVFSDGFHASPVMDTQNNRLFAGTVKGDLYALNAQNGDEIWCKSVAGKYDPRILSDLLHISEKKLILFSSWEWKFFAIDSDSGADRFSLPAGPSPRAGASAAENGTIYALRPEFSGKNRGVRLIQINPDSDEESSLFFQPLDESARYASVIAAAPVIDNERQVVIFAANLTHDSVIHAVSIPSGNPLWKYRLKRNVYATPLLLEDGAAAVGDLNGDLHCIDKDGALHYRYKTGSYYIYGGAVCLGDGNVYVGDSEGKVHYVNAQGIGEPFFEAERCIEGRPSFSPDGKLYVPSTDGNVYVFA